MDNQKTLLNRAVKTGIFAIGILSATQLYARSMIEAPPIVNSYAPMIDTVFLTSDIDGNGQLSVDEFYQLHTAAALIEFEITFKTMDNDGSGDLNQEEFISFLPAKEVNLLGEQFINASGEDGLMDIKEFSIMRIEEQGANPGLLWKFALMDKDRNRELTPEEFYGQSMIEPPLTPPPEVITPLPPKPEQVIDPTDPEPELIIDPTPADPEKPEPELIVDPIPVEPSSELLEKIAELKQQLALMEKRMARIEKSINRTQEKMSQTSSDRKASRLERRLERQTDRLENLRSKYEATTELLQETEEMISS